MLPFIILIQFLLNSGFILHPFLSGFLCGFPTGALQAHELYRGKRLTGPNYQALSAIANNASIGFVLFAVGFAIYKSIKIGWFLLGIQIVTSLLMWLLFYKKTKKNDLPKQINNNFSPLTSNFSPFKSSAIIMSIICTTVIFFSCIISILQSWCVPPFLTSLLEMTNGIAAVPPLPFASFLLGFGGLCVAFQTFSTCSNINKTKYIFLKLTQGIIASLLTFLFLTFF